MKKILSVVLAALLLAAMMVPAMAEGEVKLGQAIFAAHGTKCFAVITVAMQGDVIADAYIDEFQMMTAGEATAVPNSEAMFPIEGKVLGSKRVNAEMYSTNMQKAGSTVAIDANYDAIEAFATGKTIAELEDILNANDSASMVDVVTGATLVDTYGYLQGILAAAKAAQ